MIYICHEKTATRRAVRFDSGKLPTISPRCLSSPCQPTSCQMFRINVSQRDSATTSRSQSTSSTSAELCPSSSDHNTLATLFLSSNAGAQSPLCLFFFLNLVHSTTVHDFPPPFIMILMAASILDRTDLCRATLVFCCQS